MFRIMASRAAVLLFFCLSMAVWAVAQQFGTDLTIGQIAPAGTKAVVLFFAASDCPISNRYIPEIERLDGELRPTACASGGYTRTPETPRRWFSCTTGNSTFTPRRCWIPNSG